jgi:hypothetical protein
MEMAYADLVHRLCHPKLADDPKSRFSPASADSLNSHVAASRFAATNFIKLLPRLLWPHRHRPGSLIA